MQTTSNEICETNNKDKKNENKYSIYDYLKENPSILLTVFSALIAIITFFAKLIAIISIKTELSYWEIRASYTLFENDSLIFTAILSIIYFCIFSFCSILSSSTVDTYIPYRKSQLFVKYYLNKNKPKINNLKKKQKANCISGDDIKYLNEVNRLKKLLYKARNKTFLNFFLNYSVIIVMLTCNSSLLTVISSPIKNDNTLFLLLPLVVQLILFNCLNSLIIKSTINKEELKKECDNPRFVLTLMNENKKKGYPLEELFNKGLRSFASNINFIFAMFLIIANCLTLCLLFSYTKFDPIKKYESFQTTTIDEEQYIVIFRDSNGAFYLEEVDIKSSQNKFNKDENTLIVYTNKQRIISSDDIEITIKKFDNIKKEHKN